jgi:hypothetical protein
MCSQTRKVKKKAAKAKDAAAEAAEANPNSEYESESADEEIVRPRLLLGNHTWQLPAP